MSFIVDKYDFLEEAYPDMLQGISATIQNAKILNRFQKSDLNQKHFFELDKAKNLCELKILEKWNDQECEAFKPLCSTYFDIASLFELEVKDEYAVYEFMKIITFGYLGEGWHLVRQYLKKQQGNINQIEISENWNSRLLNKSFKALVCLIRKNDWNDINEAIDIIDSLRLEQSQFEKTFLEKNIEEDRPSCASELVALYHFAKAIEILAQYLIGSNHTEPESLIEFHLYYANEYAEISDNISLQLLFKYFDSFCYKLVRNTIWYNTRNVNSRISKFNTFISQKKYHGVFELLYPQKEALGEIFNPAFNAIVVNLPTSSGKTMIAKYRILMALNQFALDGGWVAYVVPTRALVNQIYNELKNDLAPIGVRVEKVSGALDLDGFEESLLEKDSLSGAFDVLVTTYEKLHLMVRRGLGTKEERPLVLAVIDEAHNIEDETRGLNLEFLLSTIKSDCSKSNFLLMTPDISNSDEIAKWLGGERGKELQLTLHWWQPNERIVGALICEGKRKDYKLKLKTLLTNKGTFQTNENIVIASSDLNDPTASKLKTKKIFASTLASKIISIDEPSIILASDPSAAFDIANELCNNLDYEYPIDEDVELVIRFVADELGENFTLCKCLRQRIGVHSSALPDEIKILIEDLMSKGKIQTLVATTTIAQGINFPVSSVIMSSYQYYSEKKGKHPMPVRDFWNLAGRVGRAGQQSLGWVGIISKDASDLIKITEFVKSAADELKSQLVDIINTALENPSIEFEKWLFRDERWSGLLQYISHLYKQSENLEGFIASLEQKLINTYGYKKLDSNQKRYLKRNIKEYAEKIRISDATLSDSTGFSTISIGKLWGGLNLVNLKATDWKKNQLFSDQNQSLQKLIGIMLQTPEIKSSMEQLSNGGTPFDRASISRLMIDWVNGKTINYIADKYFTNEEDSRKRIEKCTKAMYSNLANAATWGLAAIQKMPNSGVNWDNLNENEKKRMANLPALLHYGVNTDEAVLMRKNNVPRSIAKNVGILFNAESDGAIFSKTSGEVFNWISSLDVTMWDKARPEESVLSGKDYKRIWEKLNGIE